MAITSASCNRFDLTSVFRMTPAVKFGWIAVFLATCFMIDSCYGQTFQYSRGWTNGKRSGSGGVAYPAAGSSQIYDVDGSVVSSAVDDVSVPALHVNLSPDGRARTMDINQILGRKLSSRAYATRKQPVWIGTFLGLDQENNSANNADF